MKLEHEDHAPTIAQASAGSENDNAPRAVKRLTLEIRTVRNIPAFAGYVAGTAKTGCAKLIVNLDALLWASVEGESGEFRRSFIDSLAHEFIHALEDGFGLLFDEEAVEAAIARVRTSTAVEDSTR